MKKIIFAISIGLLTVASFAQKPNKYAKEITIKKDKFDDKTTWSSPFFNKGIAAGSKQPVGFVKVKQDGRTVTYLSLTQIGLSLSVNIKGVKILFADGDKIEFPDAEVDVEANTPNWKYSTFIRISEEDLDKFTNKSIDSFRLYIYDGTISKRKGKKIRGWAQAIKEAN